MEFQRGRENIHTGQFPICPKYPFLYVVIGSQYGVLDGGNAGHHLSTIPPHTHHFSAGGWVVVSVARQCWQCWQY